MRSIYKHLPDPLPRRPWMKPIGWKWSDFAIGRRLTLAQLALTGEATVSAYWCQCRGNMRYTDPVNSPPSSAGPGVRYRVRIKLKQ